MRARVLRIATACLLCCVCISAQKPKLTPPPPAPQTPPVTSEQKVKEPPHELTATDVEAFLAGFMPMQLERENIAGAVVCVVKDGKVLFTKGYGYSNVEKKTPVSPDNTLFRPGSISKLFTWTAVMQLVQQGKLDLDRDINEYLDFKIPAAYGKPITLRNLMTHTPGFEETIKELFIPENKKIVPLKDYLTQHMPKRIFPPGEVPAYSNYGATLAGYIVEKVSGQPFNDYVTQNIFKPLGMQHSTFAQPLPEDLKPLMSEGHELGSGKAKPFEVLEPAPAGSLSTTATDLSHFMIANLQEGKYEGAQILSPEVTRQMHSRQPGFHPDLNAMDLGFYQETRNGHQIIGHGGDTIYFHSDLHLILDAGVGFYVSYNSAGKGEISGRSALWVHFLDRYFPYTPPDVPKMASAESDAKAVAGYYMTSRRGQNSFIAATNPFGESHVIPDKDGMIKITPFKDFNGQIKTWREIAPMVYRDANGQDRIAFRKDPNGRMELLVNFPAVLEQRVSWTNSRPFNTFVLVGCLGILVLVLLLWPVAAVVRKHYGWKLELSESQRRWRRMIRLVSLVDVVFVVGLLVILAAADDLSILSGKLDPWMLLFQVVGLLGAIGTLLVIYATFRSWRDPGLWRWTKIFNLLIMLACIGFAWYLMHWSMINFNMNY